jgi:CheY-like chemotaxis protein
MGNDNEHILVIDDEPAILRVLKKMLNPEGFEVDTANSGLEGLAKVQLQTYDLLITDIKMPGVSGIQVARAVREIKADTLPVIGMSGTPWLLDRDLFDDVLSKPFLKADLLAAVTHTIKHREQKFEPESL